MNPIDPKRYYEVTELHPDDGYQPEMIGTIIQATSNFNSLHDTSGQPGFRSGAFRIIRGRGAYKDFKRGYFYAARLRPLTIKEQEKIDEAR